MDLHLSFSEQVGGKSQYIKVFRDNLLTDSKFQSLISMTGWLSSSVCLGGLLWSTSNLGCLSALLPSPSASRSGLLHCWPDILMRSRTSIMISSSIWSLAAIIPQRVAADFLFNLWANTHLIVRLSPVTWKMLRHPNLLKLTLMQHDFVQWDDHVRFCQIEEVLSSSVCIVNEAMESFIVK